MASLTIRKLGPTANRPGLRPTDFRLPRNVATALTQAAAGLQPLDPGCEPIAFHGRTADLLLEPVGLQVRGPGLAQFMLASSISKSASEKFLDVSCA
jgi:hypothetical protein